MPPANTTQGKPLRGALLGTGPISIFHMIAWRAIPDVRS